MRYVFGRYTMAGIPNKKLNYFVIAGEPNGNFSCLGILDGVVKQVSDNFPHAIRVDMSVIQWLYDLSVNKLGCRITTEGKLHLQSLFFGCETQAFDQLLEERADFDHLGVVDQTAILGLGTGQKILE